MSENKKTTIIIIDSRFKQTLIRLMAVLLLCIAPISIGILLASSVMQWVGFLFGLFNIAGFIIKKNRECTFNSIAEAEMHLAKMKAGAQ